MAEVVPLRPEHPVGRARLPALSSAPSPEKSQAHPAGALAGRKSHPERGEPGLLSRASRRSSEHRPRDSGASAGSGPAGPRASPQSTARPAGSPATRLPCARAPGPTGEQVCCASRPGHKPSSHQTVVQDCEQGKDLVIRGTRGRNLTQTGSFVTVLQETRPELRSGRGRRVKQKKLRGRKSSPWRVACAKALRSRATRRGPGNEELGCPGEGGCAGRWDGRVAHGLVDQVN